MGRSTPCAFRIRRQNNFTDIFFIHKLAIAYFVGMKYTIKNK